MDSLAVRRREHTDDGICEGARLDLARLHRWMIMCGGKAMRKAQEGLQDDKPRLDLFSTMS